MLKLKVGVTKNPRFEPLVDKTVKSPRLDLDITVTTPPELFFRNLKNDEFDVFEMSLSEYLITRERPAAIAGSGRRCLSFPPKHSFGWVCSSARSRVSRAWPILKASALACLTMS